MNNRIGIGGIRMAEKNAMEIHDISKKFKIGGMILGTTIVAVEDVNLSLPADKPWIFSIVGESGSGKTTLAKMILRLLDQTKGEISVEGVPLSTASRRNRKEFYKLVQPIFQNPFSTFSTRKTVDTYLYETALNLDVVPDRDSAKEEIIKILATVGLEYNAVAGKYPNQFSGGELQRISIARALLVRPKIIVADEPVAMIDASLRMNIVNLFKKLKVDFNVNFIYITHDLSTAYYVSDYLATMYRGNIIEFGNARVILENPMHPYTRLLLDSIPRVGLRWDDEMVLPDLESKEYLLGGCKFCMRCSQARDKCKAQKPVMITMDDKRQVLCFLYE
jgi:peptide/nickel transport system ATP-binding protein